VLEFRILGPLEVLADDRPVRLGGPKQRAVLAILLLSANRVVSVERLADDLYAGAPPVTAVTQVQRQVSDLRKLLGPDAIETRTPGYVLRVEPGLLDLDRFERWTHDAARALERGDPTTALDLLERALGAWHGAALADLAYESFAQPAIARLEELRLLAVEQRIDAELQLGRHVGLLAELEELVWAHPLRERLRGQLMLALYRAGRQADALELYRATRARLVDEFGIEPSRSLADLERRILVHDPSLDTPRGEAAPGPEEEREVLVAASEDGQLGPLLALAAPLAASRTLIVTRLVRERNELEAAAAGVREHVETLGLAARTAAFTSLEPARDVVRLATSYDVELVLVAAGAPETALLAEHSPADVAVLHGRAPEWSRGGVYVPFGGAANDWAALELAALLAAAARVRLTLVGTEADPARGRRDASRLLADASLAVQRVVGVAAEPLLASPTADALLAAVEPASLVVAALPARYATEGLDPLRAGLVRGGSPVLLVERGTRPGVLAPRDSWTRFSWSLEPH
jgi:DNA-binding SARP family transcriptional activator